MSAAVMMEKKLGNADDLFPVRRCRICSQVFTDTAQFEAKKIAGVEGVDCPYCILDRVVMKYKKIDDTLNEVLKRRNQFAVK